MSHKLLDDELVEKPKRKAFKLSWPKMEGKFGLAFYIGSKEVFVGVALADVIKEEVTRRKLIKTPKSMVRVFRFD